MSARLPIFLRVFAASLFLVSAVLMASGCHDNTAGPLNAVTRGTSVVAIDLSIPTHPQAIPDTVALATARNSWTQFVVQLDCSQFPSHPVLRLPHIANVSASAYRILSAPVDLNDAGYVRQTGEQSRTRGVPRVLLPLPISNGTADLDALRDPANPADVTGHPTNGSVLIWIDLNVSPDAVAGDYHGECEITDSQNHQSAGAVPVRLTVENLSLPAERHLHFTAPLEWSALTALHPAEFEPVTPRLLSRSDPRVTTTLQRLNEYLQLAHDNKADFFVPRLQPIVKWPLGKMPEVGWSDFDAIVSPWLTGKAFADHTPVTFWPLPAPDSLSSFDLPTRIQFWHVAAEHFDQMQWLDRSPVVLHQESTGPVTEADSILISAEAGKILASHPRITTLLPLQDDQAQLVSPVNPSAIALESTSRLMTVAPGLVCTSPIRDWPTEALPPRHWIDAMAQNGSFQTAGLSSEQGVRTLAWLAFSRDASIVLCGDPLPSATDPVAGNQLIWCYPGDRFGVNQALPTIQMKWLRQAEQDFEYLLLASQSGDRDDALHMCRLITKPVQLQPAQDNQPLFNLLAGATDPHASEQARQLIASRLTKAIPSRSLSSTLRLRPEGRYAEDPDRAPKNPALRSTLETGLVGPSSAPNGDISTDPVALQTLRWFTARQKPTVVATGARWMWNLNPDASGSVGAGHWIDAMVDVDLYNPADAMATGSQIAWTSAPSGWEDHPADIDIPALKQYQVRSFTTTARFSLDKISADSRQPIELTFVDGFNGQSVPCKLVLPVATSERRQSPITIDGWLDDWFPADAIQLDQPLVRMLNRPALQAQDLQLADPPASIYTSWSDDNFYLAFRLGGVATADLRSTRNFVQYDHGRAWGEDLCELLIQPIYLDNSTGPTMHVVCKPGGNWVEQEINPADPWQPFEACGIRYASRLDPEKIWRGEVAIPWKAIAATGRGRPALLRFNFIQHQNSTAQSASWAGPIDQSRDGKLAGLLLLKEP